jgi:serine/threonine protein kinase
MDTRTQLDLAPPRERGDADLVPSPEPEDALVARSPSSHLAAPEQSSSPAELADEPQSGTFSRWNPPSVVGRYRIERIIGRGGMGQVYLAWDTGLHRHVAMKFIIGMDPDATIMERFMIEARATARIQHPNVLTIHDVNEIDGRPYLVMEFLSGETLDRLPKPMDWARALELGISLSRGLAAAHRQGVLHRDIKPDNVMLVDGYQLKLLDFGLAKLATHLSTPNMRRERVPPSALKMRVDPRVLTDAGAILGTPGYMAPESWRGRATRASDVYSVGAVLYELCAGRPPHGEMAPHALALAVQRRDAPLLTEVVPTIDRRFARIIARCLSRAERARYASAEELHEALRGLERPASSGPVHAGELHRGISGSMSWSAGRAGDPSDPPDGCGRTMRRRASPSPETTMAARSMVFREMGALVISVLSAEAPADAEWDAYLQLCRTKMVQESIGVLAVTAGGGPTTKQRWALRELLLKGPVLAAVVTDAPTLRGIVTALGWFNPGIRTFKNRSGLNDALRYLRVADSTAKRVVLEIRAMQRELA